MSNGKIIGWRYEICNVGGLWVEEQTPHKPDEEMFVVRNVRPIYAEGNNEMNKKITAMEPQRDECGFWTHPDYFVPANGMEYAAPGEFEAWKEANNVVGHLLWMESDVTDEQLEALEAGDGDISQWNPTPPDGEGWFIGSIHDTEDGPLCVWLCPVEGQPRALKDHISKCHVAALKMEFINAHQVCLKAAQAYFFACDIGEDRTYAQRRAGITDEQMIEAMETKLPILKARSWPEPKDGEPRFHIKVEGE